MPTPRPAPAGPRGRAAGGALAGPATVGPTGRLARARGPGRARNWVTESATTVVEGAVALQVVRFGLKAAQGKAKEATVDAAKDGLTMLRNTPEVAVVGQKKWLKLGASVVIDGLGVAVSWGGGEIHERKGSRAAGLLFARRHALAGGN